MCFVYAIGAAALGVGAWFWNASGFSGVFFVVLTFLLLMLPMSHGKESPRFVATWQSICTLAACILIIVLEDTVISYSIMFTCMVTIAIYKMLPLLNGDFFDVKINDEPIMIEEKLYDLIDKDLSESLRTAVLIPVIGFYCLLAVPYVSTGEIVLAFLPFVFVLYRTIRIYMMTA